MEYLGNFEKKLIFFNEEQKRELINALFMGISEEGLELIANPELEFHQMRIIRILLRMGVDINRLRRYVKKENPSWLLYMIGEDILRGIDDNLIEEYERFRFDRLRAIIIRNAIHLRFNIDEIKLIANDAFSYEQMWGIYKDFLRNLKTEQGGFHHTSSQKKSEGSSPLGD